MEKIKKIGKGLLLTLVMVIAVGAWMTFHVTPMISHLLVDSITLLPTPTINNPAPQCSECLTNQGVAPKCVAVCMQEIIFSKYTTKPYLQCLAGK
jgi:hypothetical protein